MKKLLAIMLTGIMAFSLIACGTTINVESTKETTIEETDPVESEPVDWDAMLAKYKDDAGVGQLIFVKYEGGTDAQLFYYTKDASEASGWKQVFECDADVSKNGIDKTKEGDNRTPSGDYLIEGAFGIKEDPGTNFDYFQITDQMYLCNDVPETYNTIIDVTKVEHFCTGTHLIEKAPGYNYVLDINYNPNNDWLGGSGIFLRCKMTDKDYTTGNVAVDEEYMLQMITTATPGCHIIIGR